MIVRKLINLISYKHDDQAEKHVEKRFSALKAAAGAVAAVISGLLVNSIKNATTEMSRQGLEAERNAFALGLTTDAYQELTYTFSQFELESQDLADVFNTLTDRAKDVEQGAQGMIEDFGMIGIKVGDIRNKKPEELFNIFADAMANTEDITKRNAAAVRLLGDDIGRKMIPMLKDGKAGIDEMRQAAHKLGVVMSEETIENAKRYQSALKRVDAVSLGLKRTFLGELLPVIADVGEEFADWLATLDKNELRQFAQTIAINLKGGLLAVLDVLKFLRDNWTEVKLLMAFVVSGVFVAKFGALVSMIKLIATFSAAIAIKWALMTAAVLLAGLAVEDFIGFLEGKDSIIGRLLGDDAEMIRDSINQALDDMKLFPAFLQETGEEVGDFFYALVNDTDATLRNFFDGIEFLILDAVDWWGDLLAGIFGDMVFSAVDAYNDLEANTKAIFTRIANFIKEKIDSVLGLFKRVKDGITSLPGAGAVGLLTNPAAYVGGLIGGGAANAAVDGAGRLARVANGKSNSFHIGKLEAKTEVNGSGLTQQQLKVATSEGTEDGIQKALKKASRDTLGGLD